MGVDAEHRHSVGYLGTCGTSSDSATTPVPPPALHPPVLHATAPNPVSPPPLLMSCWDPRGTRLPAKGFHPRSHLHDVLLPMATNPPWAPSPQACGSAQELHPPSSSPAFEPRHWGGSRGGGRGPSARSRAVTALQGPQHLAGRLCYLATCGGERKGNSAGGTRSAPGRVGVPQAPTPKTRQHHSKERELPAWGPANTSSLRAPRDSAVH